MFYNKIDKNARITENRKTFIFISIIITTKGGIMKKHLIKTDCENFLQHYTIIKNKRVSKVDCAHCLQGKSNCLACPHYKKSDKTDQDIWFSVRSQIVIANSYLKTIMDTLKKYDVICDETK